VTTTGAVSGLAWHHRGDRSSVIPTVAALGYFIGVQPRLMCLS
jgi:hypothetical protein